MIGKSVRLAMLVCAGSCMIGLAMAQDPSDLLFRQRIAEAWAASSDHRPAVADRLLDAVIVDARFESLPVNDQVPLLSRAAFAAWQNNRLDVASDRYARIGQLGSDDPDDWYRMALVSYARSDFDAAARAMAIFIGRWPELLPNLDADVLFSLMFNGDTASQDRIAYYQALFDSNWDGGSAGTLGAAWFRLARTRLEQGDVDGARIVARRIQEPEVLLSMRADRRFDAVLDHAGWRANISNAAERQVDRMRGRTLAHPRSLDAMAQLGYALLLVGRHEDVIALSDATAARIAAAGLDDPPYADPHNQAWLMNNKSIALERMGRIDEAREELARASHIGGRGGSNVGQSLNLGQMYCSLGDAAAAGAAISGVASNETSNYGKAVAAKIRHCIARLEGDQDAETGALVELEALQADAPITYLKALLESHQSERAVDLARELLDSPEKRTSMLDWAQECRLPPPLPQAVAFREKVKAFLAREDILRAINAVGRIESYDIYC
ncbi:MAG: hypothetical protein NVV60_14475 [Luteimonas sp.]|nr:hypothetical protein [Luteimonas sp.]